MKACVKVSEGHQGQATHDRPLGGCHCMKLKMKPKVQWKTQDFGVVRTIGMSAEE